MAAAVQPVTSPPSLPPFAQRKDAPITEAALTLPEKPPAPRSIPPNSVVARLPVELEVGVPVREFRVRNLLGLQPGVVVASQWNHEDDLPLCAGNVQLAWTEFEIVITSLAARITRVD